ncbi:unnamed protein product (macronuclear) [Paramecium tetraurelia]|uniref:ABC transmembrane type-1 domain-containing protein n=1 Tax=Paramecium tetraurelia TaxID=5888 RepID=A0DZY9_PARTE|nr:uncharacterized protein GSPATT00021774001 [Paramecium tetraurelia]CAK88606.1 unnamed protein product [Paramecium tetraurelia]|eukprot:XP_001456003.1 hypothetical protein (macronuclear) [Paramecium tetraurelia strain d4-2]
MQKGISENFTTNHNFSIDDVKFYVLPPQGEINFKGNANEEELSQNDHIQQPLKSIANELIEKTIPIRQSWVLSKQAHQFNLPPSYFKQKVVIQRNNDKHLIQKEINQNDFVPYLDFDNHQLHQIRQEGVFDVYSKNNPNIKYRWILSRWVVKGTKNIRNTFYKDMLKAQDCLTGLGDFIYTKENFDSLWNYSIVHGLYTIIKKTLLIPSLFIGYREMILKYSEKQAQIQVESKRQLSLRNKNLNFSIYQYLYHTPATQSATQFKVDDLKNQLKQFEQDCWKIVALLSDKYINRQNQNIYEQRNLEEKYHIIYDQNKDIEELINEQLNNAQRRFVQQNSLDMPEGALKQILDIAECQQLQRYYKDLLKNSLADYENQVTEQYEKQFFFLNKPAHRKQYINEKLKIRKKNLKGQYYNQMIQELAQQNILDRNIFIEFTENKKKYKQKVKEFVKQKKQSPNITYLITRFALPPYPIIYEENKFELVKEVSYKVTSKYFGWKLNSLCIIYYMLISDSYYWFYQFGIMGSFGLNSLFSIKPFYNDKKINELTGEVIEVELVQTICSTLNQVYKGMRQSRKEFEELESSGLFGKGCQRIYNLLEVYVFRFLFVGVFYTLILQPILILFFSAFLFFLFITSFIWAFFLAVLRLMVCILIYDFETAFRIEFKELNNIHSILPLFRVFVDIMIGMLEVLACLICLLILPLFAMIVILFGIIRYMIRSMYDCFMMTFVYCCGRVPRRSGCLVWRLEGDNGQKKIVYNYHKLSSEEFQILAAREIEKYIIQEYQNRLIINIQKPEKEINRYLQPFFKFFNATYQIEDKNSKLLQEQLAAKIANLNQNQPVLDKETKKYIKFSENELSEIKHFLKIFVIEQLNLKNMHSYIWKQTGLQIGQFSELVDIILKQIFGNEILIPNKELIQEAQFKVEKEKGFGQQIERAMNGEVNLNKPVKYILEKKQDIKLQITKKVYKIFIPISEMLDKIWAAQQTQQEWSSLSRKDLRFLLNYSLINE